MIIVNQLHHELLIAHCKSQIRKLPEGRLGTYRGKAVVIISRDPWDKNVNQKNKKRYVIDSKNGKIYAPLIAESCKLKAKLKYLNALWNNTYFMPPRDITFPLNKSRYGNLTKEQYRTAAEMQNPILMKNQPIEYKGRLLRSKNELIACESLDHWGYEYKVEIDLSPDKFTQMYPDVTYYAPEIEKPISIEIDGAVDNESYFNKAENRKHSYLKQGYLEYKDIFFLRIYNANDFYYDTFKNLIAASIFCNLSDIII